MVKRERYLQVITAVLALSGIPALCQEPNSTEADQTVLKFEMRDKRYLGHHTGRTAIRPTHVAEMALHHISGVPDRNNEKEMRVFLGTAAGRGFSEEQCRFLKTTKSMSWGYKDEDTEGGGMFCYLYAVSEEDAKKMAEAMLEYLGKRALEKRGELENRIREYQGQISKIREELKKQQEDEKELGLWIGKRYKEGLHSLGELGIGSDEAKEAKEIVLEMEKLLNALQIEISGIKARLEAIDKYRSSDAVGANALVKLEQLQCEQTIELAGALARKRTAIEIHTREKEFYHKYTQRQQLSQNIQVLRRELSDYEGGVREVRKTLDGPNPDLDPPKVFGNKAVIYKVEIKD